MPAIIFALVIILTPPLFPLPLPLMAIKKPSRKPCISEFLIPHNMATDLQFCLANKKNYDLASLPVGTCQVAIHLNFARVPIGFSFHSLLGRRINS